MKLIPCRDCEQMVSPDARGCPTCARNMEAERMLWKYFRRALALVVCISIILLGLFLIRR
jgi:hypothetical protein